MTSSTILVERAGNRLVIKPAGFLGSDRFAQYLDLLRPIGARYSKVQKGHTAPLDLETCRQLRTAFGPALTLGPQITAWAREAVEAEKALAEALNLDPRNPVHLPVVAAQAPQMHAALLNRSYQTVAVAFGRTARSFLIADQPGLGKTLETFATLVECGVRGTVLVAAPQTSLWPTWANEVTKWLSEVGAEAFVAGDSSLSKAKREAKIAEALASDAPLKFLMVNAEMLRVREDHFCDSQACDGTDEYCPQVDAHRVVRNAQYPVLLDTVWDSVVGDEVHKYLLNSNPRSKKVTAVGLGFQKIKVRQDGLRIALSGTPMKGKPRLLWPIFRWLRPDLYTSQWRWTNRYFEAVLDEWSGENKPGDDLKPSMEEAFNREISRLMIRRTKQELRALNPSWAPPEKRYAEVWLPLGKEQRKAYESMKATAIAHLKGGTLSANGILAEFTRLRQFASCAGTMESGSFKPDLPSNKFDWLGGFLSEQGITGSKATEDGSGKVVVASQFTAMINLWANALRAKGIDCFVLTGETKGPDRSRMIAEWQSGAPGPRVFLLNTNAGGVSVTLDAADDLVIMDETWVPDDQEQVEDRVHRTSRTDHQVTIWYVRSEDTIERDLAGENIIKDDRQKRVLDGRRGIVVARQMYNVNEEVAA